MYFVLGESSADAHTVRVLVKRLLGAHKVAVKPVGHQGASSLLSKGARVLKELFRTNPDGRFIICRDADGRDPDDVHAELQQRIVAASDVPPDAVRTVVPVQEIEAWILADEKALSKVFTSWQPQAVPAPESIQSPKEFLVHHSRNEKRIARYNPVIHNEQVVKYTNLEKLRDKCPSFRVLYDWMRGPDCDS